MAASSTKTKSTPPHIVERNRRNGQHSTGPRTAKGKAVARCNSMKHGLTANPAAGVVEDVEAFERLHSGLIQRVQPRDEIEAGLVHRVAVCLWRLQRAARIDAAMSNIQCQAIQPMRERVQDMIGEIWRGWREELAWESKEEWNQRRKKERNPQSPRRQNFMRPYLHSMDAYRETLMKSGAAIIAMSMVLNELYDLLQDHPTSFWMTHAELMAWLLGENAERLTDKGGNAVVFPDEQPWHTSIDELIGIARKRGDDDPMPHALETIVKNKLLELRSQRVMCEEPIDWESYEQHKMAALLPDAAAMDRLIRYETHADRGLHRAIETLAKLRGATVERVMARLTGRIGDGDMVELQGERTTWTTPSA